MIPHYHPLRPTADLSHFYVITVISNSARYETRYEWYWRFAKLCKDAGVNFITVELQLGDRPFMVTEPNHRFHVQLRTIHEAWHKENLINIGVARACEIDPLADKVAWVDADCAPTTSGREWFEETWHQLQHFEIVQMWEHLINFGPQNQPVSGPQLSFMATYAKAGFVVPQGKTVKHTLAWNTKADGYDASNMIGLGRPGLAWAANISALNQLGGVLDFCILGSGDWHMAHGLVGAMNPASAELKMSKYGEALLRWQELAQRWLKRDVGHVPVTVLHWWHGKKVDRRYGDRGLILTSNQYNPDTDIKYDARGVIQLETHEPRQIRLRDQIRSYFATRNEDSIDL